MTISQLLLWGLRGLWSKEPVCGHRITQPADRRKAIATWHRCAQQWMWHRFPEDKIEGWKPAQTQRVGAVVWDTTDDDAERAARATARGAASYRVN